MWAFGPGVELKMKMKVEVVVKTQSLSLVEVCLLDFWARVQWLATFVNLAELSNR